VATLELNNIIYNYTEEVNMGNCTPVNIRKNLVAVKEFMANGIDVIVMPIRNDDHRRELELEKAKTLMFIINDRDEEEEL